MNKCEYGDLVAFHPGRYVKELMDDMEITQSEFARRLNTTEKTLSNLVNCTINLSDELAGKLAMMTGTSVAVWLNLQEKYIEKCHEIEQRKKADTEKRYLKMLNYSYFVKIGVVNELADDAQKIKALCGILMISSLSILGRRDLLTSCRTSTKKVDEKNVVNANAWIQLGTNVARNCACQPYSHSGLTDIIPRLRSLTFKNLSAAFPEVQELLAQCGVALVALPYMKQSGLSGAVKWLSKDKVMLLINDRGKNAASFWFTLFHEIKHILQRKLTFLYLTPVKDRSGINKSDILSLGRNNPDEETDADNFACEKLIPGTSYKKFIALKDFSLSSIKKFSDEIGVSDDIVIGRLQHENLLPWNVFAERRKQYQFVI